MIKIGMMIGDRYEILEKIGTGGMSDVYKAKCHKLNRYVAIKVLKQEFSENANFVSKFRIEAQAAAGLMHPNIVNVYDVGEENGIYYIVMELVEGITLKKYIEKKARLSYKEAVSIAIQVSMGIEAAHSDAILKPQYIPDNYRLNEEKITDTTSVLEYGNDKKHLIFQQTIVTNEKMIFDTNYNSVEQIRINGMTVFLYRYTDETFWAYGEYGNSVYVLAGDTIQKEEIEKIYKHWIW